jgi:hypothetical protein
MIIIKNITQNQNIPYHPALGRQYTVSLSNDEDITLYDEDFLDQYKEYRKKIVSTNITFSIENILFYQKAHYAGRNV